MSAMRDQIDASQQLFALCQLRNCFALGDEWIVHLRLPRCRS